MHEIDGGGPPLRDLVDRGAFLDEIGHVCDVHADFVLVTRELLHREGVVQIPKLKVDLLDALRVKGRHDTGRFIRDASHFVAPSTSHLINDDKYG